ncbi:MAG TPA: tRNA (adenosine(37)-N6)-threonylcarbamoyltransferase complex dimerization subunit type 1 TsaB [Verrucomicrobiae bacterium]
MTILALEFSSPQRSVASARGNSVLSEAVETGGRNTAAFGMIEKVLAAAKIEREEIETIVIGLGPGSYTGIRAAIAVAQGWQLARKTKLIGINSVEAMVAEAQAQKFFGRVNVAIDAQRNEFYLAIYEIAENEWKEIEPLKIVTLAELQSRVQVNKIVSGSEIFKCFPNVQVILPRATRLAEIAAGRNDFCAGEKLEPIYLRETNFVKSSLRPSAAS